MNQLNTRTQNYLVPASGTTNSYTFEGVLQAASPINWNWNTNALDGQVFIPSGVFVDNTKGTGDITITIDQLNFSMVIPAGAQIAKQYPAPLYQSVTISVTVDGQASIVFVDFPVIPCNF